MTGSRQRLFWMMADASDRCICQLAYAKDPWQQKPAKKGKSTELEAS